MSTPVWATPAGALRSPIAEGEFYEISLEALAPPKTVFYKLQAGALPPGMQIDTTGIMSGNPSAPVDLQGVPLQVQRTTTSKFAIRAYTTANNQYNGRITGLADRTFTLTINNTNTVFWTTPAGNIGTYFDGVQIRDLQLEYGGVDPTVVNVITIIGGNLPPGLTLSTDGVISGYITPQPQARDTTTTYTFQARVANALSSDVRTFSLLIYARSKMTADNFKLPGDNPPFGADNTFVTADASPVQPPIITTPLGSIGTTRSDNYFAFQFRAYDFYENDVEFIALSPLPPGLTLDASTGWLYGYIPYEGLSANVFTFDIQARVVYVSNDTPVLTNTANSTTSLTVNTGIVSLTIEPDEITLEYPELDWILNKIVSIYHNQNNYMVGSVISYNITTGTLIVNVTSIVGSGTYNKWLIGEQYFDELSVKPIMAVTSGFRPSGYLKVGNELIGYNTKSPTRFGRQGPDPLSPPASPIIRGVYPTSAENHLIIPGLTVAQAEFITSGTYTYTLTIDGPVDLDILWLTPFSAVERQATPSFLGTIDNGTISTFRVEAESVTGIPIQYRLSPTNPGRLPQGLQLLSSGHIAGRVSFDTFCLDGGTTTFDVNLNTVAEPTTFDMVCVFTVNVFSANGLVNTNKEFSIRVIRRYEEPFDNLYIQAMPPQDDRALINDLLLNPNIFPPDKIYRADDPYFGVARRVIYNHAFGLTAKTIEDYVASLELNHYWKNLVLGPIRTARALDADGTVMYEVVYSEIVDDLVNNDGVSVNKQVVLPFPIDVNGQQTDSVYPNSLEDMRDQVIDQIGQISNVLPRWMLSTQEDGRVLGFTPSWVIAYTRPGESKQIAYNIQTFFTSTTQLNLVDFKADRYELDNLMTKNWNREDQHWNPRPPTLTTFDYSVDPPTPQFATWGNYNAQFTTFTPVQWVNNSGNAVTWTNTYNGQPTTFDGNNMQFTAPVDMYEGATTDYDKYLLFPKSNILQ